MITKNTLNGYGFNSITDYFNYVYMSLVNGQYAQVKDLINRLSVQQQKEFNNWIFYHEYIKQEHKNYLFGLLFRNLRK